MSGRIDGAASFTTEEGLEVRPLYERLRRDEPRPWRSAADWSVSQRIDHPDAEAANALALLDLEGGADALVLVGHASPFARGFGLTIDREALRAAFRGIELDLIALRLDAGPATPAAARELALLLSERGLRNVGIRLDLCFDPIGCSSVSGQAWDAAALHAVVALSRDYGLVGHPVLADGRPYHEAGAGDAQELAAVLANVVAYLRHFETVGLPLAEAIEAIVVLVTVDADVMLATAKVRAVRRLVARISALCDVEPRPLRLHVETSWRMMTRYDPWTNAMRTTAATAAAGVAGADSVTCLPMTLPLGLPDAEARRLARNTNRILLDESMLGRVDDPSAGAGAIEALTQDLCERSWALFQAIEQDGGIEAALRIGALQAAIAGTAEARRANVATLRRRIVGTSRFPALHASVPRVLDVARRAEDPTVAAMLSCRDAEPFERLRDQAEARAAKGARPQVFLAPLGTPDTFGPRMADAANIFAVAGLDGAITSDAIDPPDIGRHFAVSGATIACLCGTEAAYAAAGGDVVAALRAAGVRRLFIVSSDSGWSERGVDAVIGDGGDMLRVLGDALDVACGMRIVP